MHSMLERTVVAGIAIVVISTLASCESDDGLVEPGSPQPSTGLVAHYRFDGDLLDLSGHDNHGHPVGQIAYVDDRRGRSGGALALDGQGSRVRVPNSPSLQVSDGAMTVTGWVLATAYHSGGYLPIVAKEQDDGFDHPLSDWEVLIEGDSVGFWPYAEFSSGFRLHDWIFFAFVVDHGVVTHCLDGEMVGRCKCGVRFSTSDQPLHIGANLFHENEFLRGALDDIRIYEVALDDAAIRALNDEG